MAAALVLAVFLPAPVPATADTMTFDYTMGSTITEASLQLYPAGRRHQLQIQEMNTAWDENSTWNSLGGGAHPGSSPLSTFSVRRTGAFYDINVVSSLQAWANGTRPNFGWVLTEPSIRRGLVGMATSEYHTLRLRPVLTVKDTAATPEPGTLFTLMGGLGVMGWWRRRRGQTAA